MLKIIFHLSGCGGELAHPFGEIKSPGYPQHYQEDVVCRWHIEVPWNHSINFTVWDFDMESAVNCLFDYLKVR